ncbi:MutS family DNA mismatch repair protein [Clostridium lundense]|uniref:MutS family DNA mismatch repair protein n=1 Tax=Clostridium lundense TaxID=319475 RepID=UPI00047FFCC0|nr:MutS family DNA mismatch repair protein [Clostridium lundense]
MEDIKIKYSKRKDKLDKLLKKQKQTINFFSTLRLITFITGVVFTLFFYYKLGKYYFSTAIFLVTIILFIVLAITHEKVIKNKELTYKIVNINEDGIKRMEGQWKKFQDMGEEFIDENHPYSNDLDIFGKASLFQYINCSTTPIGRRKLKETFESYNYTVEEIYKRQDAIAELGKKISWRQRYMGEGLLRENKKSNLERLLNWAGERYPLYSEKFLVLIVNVLPIVTIVLSVLFLTTSKLHYYIPLFFIFIQTVLLFVKKGSRSNSLDTVYIHKKDIQSYYEMIKLIEKGDFKSQYLRGLEKNLEKNNVKASDGIRELVKISNLTSDRKNFLYLPFNILTLWDYHTMMKLEKWKKNWGEDLEKWLNVIGEFEVLSSLALLRYENPTWAMPTFEEDYLLIKGKNMAHPLVGEKAVKNDLTIGKEDKILLITGSNMSGKSTLLRTVGINLVLAYVGAPVCCESFHCSLMDIYTCMRISDNLEKNISSFYGELLRIKELMEGVKNKKPIFFLLDEIFKGTNSIDRHTGAKILINKLSNEKVLGLVSTHDLELGDLEKENKQVKNYYFREYYKNNEIHFDYKLRKGISTTRNALYLMKLAGIDIEDDDKIN